MSTDLLVEFPIPRIEKRDLAEFLNRPRIALGVRWRSHLNFHAADCWHVESPSEEEGSPRKRLDDPDPVLPVDLEIAIELLEVETEMIHVPGEVEAGHREDEADSEEESWNAEVVQGESQNDCTCSASDRGEGGGSSSSTDELVTGESRVGNLGRGFHGWNKLGRWT